MTSSTSRFARSPAVFFGAVLGMVALSSCIEPFSESGTSDAPDNINLQTYTVGGTYTGLIGSLLDVETAGELFGSGQEGSVTAPDGTFSLLGSFSPGNTYDLTVTRQPTNPSQTCVILNGSGTVGNSSVTNIVMTCTTNPARFVYVANSGSNDVSAYRVDVASGTLTTVAGSPFAAGSMPDSIAVDPSGRFVYVSNQGDATVSAYTINRANGALNAVNGSPFPTGEGPDVCGHRSQQLIRLCNQRRRRKHFSLHHRHQQRVPEKRNRLAICSGQFTVLCDRSAVGRLCVCGKPSG